jgi:hypothetical protein
MPLEDLEVIDIVLKPDQDGKVGLVIMDAGVTKNQRRRSELFREKVRAYFGSVVDGHFKKEYPGLKTPDFYIKAVCTTPPTPEMYEWHQIQSKSRPEHHMEVRFEQFDGRPWPGQKFDLATDPAGIAPPSDRLKEFAEAELHFAFETIRDNCFQTFAAWLDNGERHVAGLFLDSESAMLCAQETAARLPRSVTHHLILTDSLITGPKQMKQDALMARASERGRPKGLFIALKYLPGSGRRKATLVGTPHVIGECENDLEPDR